MFTRSLRPASATLVPSPLGVFLAASRRIFDGHAKRAKRHEVERMLDFEDALLSDIGITRDDVHYALAQDEPSLELARAARCRTTRQLRSSRSN